MIGSFKDLVTGDEFTRAIPASLVATLSEELPEGFHYELSDDGRLLIATPDEECEKQRCILHNPRFTLSETGEKAFGDLPKTEESVMRYLRNSQEQARIDADSIVVVANGKELPAEDGLRPVSDFTNKGEVAVIIGPSPLREVDIEVASKGITRNMHFRQLVTHSATKEVYLCNDGPITLRITVDALEESFSFNVSASFELVNCAREYYETVALFNGILEGDFAINGIEVGLTNQTRGSKPRKASEGFWKKAAELEDQLGCRFNVQKPFVSETVMNVLTLHACLVDKRAVKQTRKLNSFSGVGRIWESQIEPGKSAMLLIPYRKSMKVFDIEVDAKGVLGAFDVVITGVATQEDACDENGDCPFTIYLDCHKKTIFSVLFLTKTEIENGFDPASLAKILQNPVELEYPKESII